MTPRIAEFMTFMSLRHQIYLDRKEGKPAPWTSDPILLKGRFCNIFREIDRVTIWVRKNVREPFADHENLWFMLAIARYLNWPPSVQALIDAPGAWPKDDSFDLKKMTAVLEEIRNSGQKLYTGAYMVRAESDRHTPWFYWPKHRYICEIVLGRLWTDRVKIRKIIENATTLEEVWAIVQDDRYVGWGPFMGYEWVTDLRHTRYLSNAKDIYSWANAGPGAIRGLNRLFGRKLSKHPDPEQTCKEMLDLLSDLNNVISSAPSDMAGPTIGTFQKVFSGHRFEMRDVEHTLCEFDKYERVRLGQGNMRAKYEWKKAEALPEE